MPGKEELDDEDFPRVTKAWITDDGALVVKFDRNVVKAKKQVLFMPEALFAMAEEYAEIETDGDFAGYPVVHEEACFADEEGEGENKSDSPADNDAGKGEEGDEAAPAALAAPKGDKGDEDDDEDDEED